MIKKGFTLVELLAVIVVLAIIFTIAVPNVFKIIYNGKSNAFLVGVRQVLKSGKEYQITELREREEDCVYFDFKENYEIEVLKNGKRYIPLSLLALSGDIPTEGEMEVCRDSVSILVGNGDFTVDIDSNGKENMYDGDIESNNISRPVIDSLNTTSKDSSITLTVEAHDDKNDIVKYYYYLNGQLITSGDFESYIFDDLKSNTSYNIKVVVENSIGLQTVMEKQVKTSDLPEPKISASPDSWAKEKEVTITYPDGNYTYEYRINSGETKENKEKGRWLTASKSESLTFTEVGNISARVTDKYGAKKEVSFAVNNIDSTKPTVSLLSRKTTNSVILTAVCNDDETEITKIEFSKDGRSFDDNKTDPVKTYDGLKAGDYTFYARCTNEVGLVEQNSTSVTIDELEKPSFDIDTDKWVSNEVGKNLTIYYPSNGTHTFKATGEFTVTSDNVTEGSVYTVNGTKATLHFTSQGSVTAYVSDDVNQVEESYLVSKIDSTAPQIDINFKDVSSKSVTVEAICSDDENDITKIEFSRDGDVWTESETNNTKTYDDLKTDTYTFYARCTNSADMKSRTSKAIGLTPLKKPDFSISESDWVSTSVGKDLTITYPTGGTHTFTATGKFSITEGRATYNDELELYTTTNDVIKLHFKTEGDVTAYASDGPNSVDNSYSVK